MPFVLYVTVGFPKSHYQPERCTKGALSVDFRGYGRENPENNTIHAKQACHALEAHFQTNEA